MYIVPLCLLSDVDITKFLKTQLRVTHTILFFEIELNVLDKV